MKKIFIAILAFIYLGVSCGIALNVHYCMNKISSVDLFHNGEKCGKCGMKLQGGCCKDEFKIIKLNDSHKLISNEINITAPVAIINHNYKQYNFNLCSTESFVTVINNSPPRTSGRKMCISNCVFRI